MESVLVIGAGAVGLYFGSRLLRAGHLVQFLGRSNALDLKLGGVEVCSLNTKAGTPLDSFSIPILDIALDWDSARPADLVLLTTKAIGNEAIRALVASKVRPNGTLIVMQNGIGEEEEYAKLLPAARILAGVCFIGASLAQANKLLYSGVARVGLAPYIPAGDSTFSLKVAEHYSQLFLGAGVQSESAGTHLTARWQKLAWNIPFNAMCIILQTHTSALLQCEATLESLHKAISEVINAGNACGGSIDSRYGDILIERSHLLGEYEPSMKVDFQAGKELELEAIYRRPIEIARALGVEMPITGLLYAQLKFCRNQKMCSGGEIPS